MNLAYYVVVFDGGTDAWLEMAGLGAAYRTQTGCSVFAVETHTLYQHEVGPEAALSVRTRLAGWGGRKLHLLHEMSSAGEVVAMQEVLFLHVDLATRRSAALDEVAAGRVRAVDSGEPLPGWVGRRVGEPR